MYDMKRVQEGGLKRKKREPTRKERKREFAHNYYENTVLLDQIGNRIG